MSKSNKLYFVVLGRSLDGYVSSRAALKVGVGHRAQMEIYHARRSRDYKFAH